jgi:PKD repeat protein
MSNFERVGDDLHYITESGRLILKDYYNDDKEKRRENEKPFLKNHGKKLALALFITGVILIAYITNAPLSYFKSNKILFNLQEDKNEFRTGYSITFSWDISISPYQAIIIWGDGTTLNMEDMMTNKNGIFSGRVNHSYSLQGKYSPILQIWDVYGTQSSDSLEITIQNNLLFFDIELYDDANNLIEENQISENQNVRISIENVYASNRELINSEEELTFLYDFSETQISSKESSLSYAWKNEGDYPITVSIIDSQGVISRKTSKIMVNNKPPEVKFTRLSGGILRAGSKIKFSADSTTDTENDRNSLRFIWNWGDNTTSFGKFVSHVYSKAGDYNVILYAIDDNGVSNQYSETLHINKPLIVSSSNPSHSTEENNPYIAIGTLPESVVEDELVQFICIIELQEGNITDYRFHWNFGDGFHSFEKSPSHSWITTGNYDITLKVTDFNNNEYIRNKQINVEEKKPEILGPFSFKGIEGQALTLDVEIYDSMNDEPDLKYEWYDENNSLFSIIKNPSVILDDGEYRYKLKVTDPSGFTSTRTINIVIHQISPEVIVPNYMFYGRSSGQLVLRAYPQDSSFDISELIFLWKIKNGKKIYNPSQRFNGNYSEVVFECSETTIYQGEVKVVGQWTEVNLATFEIYSCIDSPKIDSDNEELEEFLGIDLPKPQDSHIDSDGDNLSDEYEMLVSNTSCYNPDTDGDGLWDGYNHLGIGELTLGTSPTNPDTDNDQLKDGLEYFGWNTSINYFENRSKILMTSNPLNPDTDNDFVSDYQEFVRKTHPRLRDSDRDGLSDGGDPFPTTWDHDQDLLSDYYEKFYGTAMDNSDSDGDGIKDGEEIEGWGILGFRTDPTSPDSDHDFVPDNAELKNYKISLEDEYGKEARINLTEPITLHFPNFFREAAIAQIAFTISFGERGGNGSIAYGIKNQDIINLNVKITKPNDDIILYNSISLKWLI